MGSRASVPAPSNFNEPKTVAETGAVFGARVIVTVLVSPALAKFKTDGFTVAVTPGTEIVVR